MFQASTVEEVKPSHIRKRNFGATFADAVDKAQAERLGEGNVLGRAKETAKDWVRVKTRPGAEAGLPGPSLTNTTEPRGRIKLRGSFLGIYSKGLATPRPPRTEEDVPQRPDKRERIRNLRIRRPFISDAGKLSTTSPTTTAATTTSPTTRAESTTTTAGTSATAARSSYSSPAPATVSVTSSERIIKLAGVVKELEYKEIVRTSPAPGPAPAPSTSQGTRAESSTGGGAATVSTSAATTPTTAATAESSSEATAAAADGSQDDGLINIDTASQKSSSKNSETLPNLGSSENVISSTSELELEVAEGGSGASAAVEPSIQSATPSTTASSTVTESKELPGSSDIKQSKAHTQPPEPSLAQVDITTRNPIEIQRPREELQKDLLEAIRRKISRNKAASVASVATQAAATQISGSQAENEGRSNFIASTKSPFYRPLSYVGSKKNASTAADSRVKIFINLPPSAKTGQDPTSVKIPNISHIRNKLERLNDAITEGLRLERQREEEAAARESDWRHGGAASSGSGPRAEVSSQRSVVKSQSSSVQIVSQHRGPAAAANSEAGNQETIRKQLVAPPSKTGTADIINQFEAATTSSTAPPPPPASTTAQSTTPIEDEATTSPAARNKEKPVSEHPSSHFRPDNWTSHDFIPMPKSNLPPKEDVQLFVVPKQQPAPARQPAATQNTTAREEAESQEQSGGQAEEEVTNTTIMVISVVAVIPVAGLVAWAVRTVLRRKVTR